MKYTYVLLVVWLLVGCTPKMQNSEYEVKHLSIPLRDCNNEIMMSTFVDSISYIPLETKDECLIGYIDKIIVTDKFYYIVDKTIANSVFCFSKSGKFVRKFGNRGVASGEYVRISDVCVYKDSIYLWDVSLQKMFVYNCSGEIVGERKFDYVAETFSVLDDSWIVFYGDYRNNEKYRYGKAYPNLLFVNINNGQIKPDLFFDSRICFTGIISSSFNFVSCNNLAISLNDTLYQAISPATLKRKYVVCFGDKYQKTKKDYIKKLETETIDAYQGNEYMKEIPYLYAYLETPSYSFLKYNLKDYYYIGIINHKESDIYTEASGYKKNNVVNDIDSIALFVPLTTYKNDVYSYVSPERLISNKTLVKQMKTDDNPVIVRMQLK